MKASILCIQFRQSESACQYEAECIRRALPADVTCQFVHILDEGVVWNEPEVLLPGIDGLILGGTGDFDFDGGRPEDDPVRVMSFNILERLRPLFEHVFAHDIPTLGICYGHQLLGAFAGAGVRSDPAQKKTRSHQVTLRPEARGHVLFADFPESFHAIYGHKDSLDRVPDSATLLIQGGEACQVSALQYKNNIFSMQFHPELTFSDMAERVKRSPGYLPEGVALEEVYVDDEFANQIIKNFGLYVVTVSKKN